MICLLPLCCLLRWQSGKRYINVGSGQHYARSYVCQKVLMTEMICPLPLCHLYKKESGKGHIIYIISVLFYQFSLHHAVFCTSVQSHQHQNIMCQVLQRSTSFFCYANRLLCDCGVLLAITAKSWISNRVCKHSLLSQVRIWGSAVPEHSSDQIAVLSVTQFLTWNC